MNQLCWEILFFVNTVPFNRVEERAVQYYQLTKTHSCVGLASHVQLIEQQSHPRSTTQIVLCLRRQAVLRLQREVEVVTYKLQIAPHTALLSLGYCMASSPKRDKSKEWDVFYWGLQVLGGVGIRSKVPNNIFPMKDYISTYCDLLILSFWETDFSTSNNTLI